MSRIKILVCYHKPFLLFENECLTPIQGGRGCSLHSKDGALPAQDAVWLHEHMIGDDTGDNLSVFNREINEWTAIYWARRNYRSLLHNPDYIGLMHYSRLMDVSGLTARGRAGCTLESALGLCREALDEVCANYNLVIAQGIHLADQHEHHAPPQPPLPLSCTYHPLLYRQCQRYEEEGIFFGYNMFIMKRDLFYAFTDECLPLLEDLLGMDPALRIGAFAAWNERDPSQRRSARRRCTYLQFDHYYPRYTGYVMELISSYFFHERYGAPAAAGSTGAGPAYRACAAQP